MALFDVFEKKKTRAVCHDEKKPTIQITMAPTSQRPLPAANKREITSGIYHNHLQWRIEEETLIISGEGPMISSDQTGTSLVSLNPWMYQCGRTPIIRKVVIEDGITSIGAGAFRKHAHLEHLAIAESVIKIGASAFTQCHGLRSITIPESVAHIGHAAFKDCKNLSEVSIHLDATTFYPSTFEGTPWLQNRHDSIVVNGTLIAVPDNAVRFTVPQNVKTIAMSAIKDKPLKELVIPQSVEQIEEFACSSCEALEVLRLPERLHMFKPVQYTPLYGCSAVKRIYYGEGKYLAVDGVKCLGVAGENVLWIQQNNGTVSIFGNGTVDLDLVIHCMEEEYADFGSYFTFRYAWESSDVEIYKGVRLSEPLPTTLPPESMRNRFSCYDIETKTCYFTVSHRNYIVSAGETTIA